MKFHEYLIESGLSENNIKQLILKDCKPFLDQSKGLTLYRGMNISPSITKEKVRKDRKPKDTDPRTQKKADEVFLKKFGWMPRSQGLFVTGNQKEAKRYGTLYRVYPIGNFKFIWSDKVMDFFTNFKFDNVSMFDELISMIYIDGSEYIHNKALERGLKKDIKTYKDTDLTGAIRSNNEIMIDCDEYYAVRYDLDIGL